MSEIQHSEIIYEEGWRENTPEAIHDGDPPLDEQPPVTEPLKAEPKPLLISIQLVLCVLFVIVLFLLKTMDSEVYRDFMRYYHEELMKPVVSQDVFDAVDEGLFGRATSDEAQAE